MIHSHSKVHPLGDPSQFVEVNALTSWGNLCDDELNPSNTAAEMCQADTL